MRHRSSLDYTEIKKEAEKPIKQRNRIIPTKHGKIIPKRYHMSEDIAFDKRKIFDQTGVFPNPFRKGGIYYGFTQALINLGVNKKHSFSAVKQEIKKVLSKMTTCYGHNAWQSFDEKQSNNTFTGMDTNGRIIETARMLQRINGFHPYGEKLRQLRSCVNVYYTTSNGIPDFELSTNFASYNDVKPIRKKKN